MFSRKTFSRKHCTYPASMRLEPAISSSRAFRHLAPEELSLRYLSPAVEISLKDAVFLQTQHCYPSKNKDNLVHCEFLPGLIQSLF